MMLLVCMLLSPDVAFNSPSPSSAFCYNGFRLLSAWDTQRPTSRRTGAEDNSCWQMGHDCDDHCRRVPLSAATIERALGGNKAPVKKCGLSIREALKGSATEQLLGWWQNTCLRSRRLEFEFLPATSLTYAFLSTLCFVMEISDGLQ